MTIHRRLCERQPTGSRLCGYYAAAAAISICHDEEPTGAVDNAAWLVEAVDTQLQPSSLATSTPPPMFNQGFPPGLPVHGQGLLPLPGQGIPPQRFPHRQGFQGMPLGMPVPGQGLLPLPGQGIPPQRFPPMVNQPINRQRRAPCGLLVEGSICFLKRGLNAKHTTLKLLTVPLGYGD